MTSTLRLGQILKGSLSSYTITKQLQDSVYLATNLTGEKSIIKSVHHWRLENERDVLRRFQDRAPGLRPLVDDTERGGDAEEAPTIVLKWFEDDALNASGRRRFTRMMWEYWCWMYAYERVDIKPDNILVNYNPLVEFDPKSTRISTARLADLGNTVPNDSEYARNGFPIGVPIFRSPEAALRLPWGCSTDIWSLGTTLISLIWGLNFHLFKPPVPADHEEYELEILMKHCQYFGPYPLSYKDLANLETQNVLAEAEISKEDKDFLGKMMLLDPRDRLTATELLMDEWFEDPGDDFPSGNRST
ncbi:hypothetical protein VE02_05865 [Pseudogymnoascus sp. 03VT05]|nr:hypothetical protein VE02_05865 [Pseudogymnoascus sp. 03VT05]